MTSPGDLWSGFTYDPRDPANAALRASDRDRNVVHQLLAEAYADGRLDREEFDLRTEQTGSARTLGELPALVGDLVGGPAALRGGRGLASAPPTDLQARAERAYESDRREAVLGFLGPSLICLVIWLVINRGELGGAFFWPGFVMAGTGINVVRTLVRRQDIVDDHARRLAKKDAKEDARELGERQRSPDAEEDGS